MKLGPDTHVPKCRCTNCNKLVDGATSVGSDAVPEPGDFTVCLYCGHIMAFSKKRRLRNLTGKEIIEVAGDERIILIQKARQAMR
jgi:hypothetical protein